ncbi:retrotransposon protein, putative, ty1-copia subclass [Tanacetum coccineum]
MVQPEGFVDPKHPSKVYKLQRSIYGLKQASRSWNKRFDEEIKMVGFTQNSDELCVYLKASGSNVAFIVLYVDDACDTDPDVLGDNLGVFGESVDYQIQIFKLDNSESEVKNVSSKASAAKPPSADKTLCRAQTLHRTAGPRCEYFLVKSSLKRGEGEHRGGEGKKGSKGGVRERVKGKGTRGEGKEGERRGEGWSKREKGG